ncbi:SRPBCC family protein, partial [Streptomyces aurantiacus]|uniref:SRPBCC family protein n=1 Tax=Streptomyces aurantiacus TaxID=47760 RepID=UPI00193A559A
TRHEITVAAPVEDVWRLHTDIAAWPLFNSGVERAEILEAMRRSPTSDGLTGPAAARGRRGRLPVPSVNCSTPEESS